METVAPYPSAGVLPRAARWTDDTRTRITIELSDGTTVMRTADGHDPLVALVLYGDPEAGLAPIEVKDLDLEILRADALKEVRRWRDLALDEPIAVAGRVYPCDRHGQDVIRGVGHDAAVAQRLGERFARRVMLVNGEWTVVTGDDAVAIWRALSLRNFGDVHAGVEGVIGKAGRIERRIAQAKSADEIGALLAQL